MNRIIYALLLCLLLAGCLSPHIGPTPTPVPPTPPTPVVDIQPGEFGLARVSYDAAKSAGMTRQEAVVLAAAHRQVVKEIGEPFGLLPDALKNMAQTVAKNLNESARQRLKPWQDAVGAKLQQLQQNGTIKLRGDWSTAHTEIAEGLEAIR